MTFERSFDYELIRAVITQPEIYKFISDDGSPPREEYRPVESEAVWYVVVWDGNELLGLFMLVPENTVCWQIHTCLLPDAWGFRAQEAAKLLPAWIWEHTPCRRIVTNVPAPNRLALHFAVRAGMKIYGVNQASYLKHGVLCDQVCLGLSPDAGMPESAAKVEEHEEETCQPL